MSATRAVCDEMAASQAQAEITERRLRPLYGEGGAERGGHVAGLYSSPADGPEATDTAMTSRVYLHFVICYVVMCTVPVATEVVSGLYGGKVVHSTSFVGTQLSITGYLHQQSLPPLSHASGNP